VIIRYWLDPVPASVSDAFRTGEDVDAGQVMGTVLASLVFFWMGIFCARHCKRPDFWRAAAWRRPLPSDAVAGAAREPYVRRHGGRAALARSQAAHPLPLKAGAPSMAGAATQVILFSRIDRGRPAPATVAAGIAVWPVQAADASGGLPARCPDDAEKSLPRGSQGACRAHWRLLDAVIKTASGPRFTSFPKPGWAAADAEPSTRQS